MHSQAHSSVGQLPLSWTSGFSLGPSLVSLDHLGHVICPMCLIQGHWLPWACSFHGGSPARKRARPSAQAHFKPLCASHLLASHWSKQVTWPNPTHLCNTVWDHSKDAHQIIRTNHLIFWTYVWMCLHVSQSNNGFRPCLDWDSDQPFLPEYSISMWLHAQYL